MRGCRGIGARAGVPEGLQNPWLFPMRDTRFRPAVIPDIFNRESMVFPMQAHTNEGTEKKDTGFPLKTGGNDRGARQT